MLQYNVARFCSFVVHPYHTLKLHQFKLCQKKFETFKLCRFEMEGNTYGPC
jgi:hypothetical protein